MEFTRSGAWCVQLGPLKFVRYWLRPGIKALSQVRMPSGCQVLHIRLFCEAVFPTASGTGTVGGLEYAPVYHNHDPDSQATAPTHLSDMYKSNDEVGLPRRC